MQLISFKHVQNYSEIGDRAGSAKLCYLINTQLAVTCLRIIANQTHWLGLLQLTIGLTLRIITGI